MKLGKYKLSARQVIAVIVFGVIWKAGVLAVMLIASR